MLQIPRGKKKKKARRAGKQGGGLEPRFVGVSEARATLATLVTEAADQDRDVILVKLNQPVAVLMSYKQYKKHKQ